MPTIDDMMRAFRTPLGLNAKAGDRILIMTDTAMDPGLWQALSAAAREMEMEPVVTIMEPRATHATNPDPSVLRAATDPELDLVIYLTSTAMAHAPITSALVDLDQRFILMEELTPAMLDPAGPAAAHAPHEADATIRREIGPRLPSSAQLSPAGPAPAPSGPRVQRLLELQRAAGNQAVVQRLSNAGLIAQREPGDELAGAAPAPGGGGGGGGTEINDTSVKITAGSIELNAPMVRVGGVASTDTLIAESVVASNYTPGAGNVW